MAHPMLVEHLSLRKFGRESYIVLYETALRLDQQGNRHLLWAYYSITSNGTLAFARVAQGFLVYPKSPEFPRQTS